MTQFSNFIATRASHWLVGLTLSIAISSCPALSLHAQNPVEQSNFGLQQNGLGSAPADYNQVNPTPGFPVAPVHFDPSVQPASASVSVEPASDPVSEMSGAWTNFTTMLQRQWQESGWAEKAKGITGDFDLGRMLGSLAIVLGGYFGLVALMRFVNPSRGGVPTEVLELLGTVPLAPRKQMQIVRLGSKLLLLVDSDEGTHPIGEISDPEEVEYLASLCPGRSKSGQSLTSRLRSAASQRTAPAQEPMPTSSRSPSPSAPPATPEVNQVAESHLAALLQSLSGTQTGANRNGPAVFEA